MLYSEAITEFIAYQYLCGHSKKTISSYRCFLKKFQDKIGDLCLDAIDNDVLATYATSLYDQKPKLSMATIRTYLVHLKAYLHWAFDNGLMAEPIYKKIKLPKSPKKVLKIYGTNEIALIFENIAASPKWIATRNRLIVALMLDAGLRQNEVATVTLSNIDFDKGILKVNGKGNKERFVPFGQLTRSLLEGYLKQCPHEIAAKEALLLSKDGDPITNNAIKLFVNKLQRKLGFPLSSHKLRHNFATNYIIDQYDEHGTVDIYKLMYIMGHEEVQTTEGYLHLAQQYIACQSNISHLDKILIDPSTHHIV